MRGFDGREEVSEQGERRGKAEDRDRVQPRLELTACDLSKGLGRRAPHDEGCPVGQGIDGTAGTGHFIDFTRRFDNDEFRVRESSSQFLHVIAQPEPEHHNVRLASVRVPVHE